MPSSSEVRHSNPLLLSWLILALAKCFHIVAFKRVYVHVAQSGELYCSTCFLRHISPATFFHLTGGNTGAQTCDPRVGRQAIYCCTNRTPGSHSISLHVSPSLCVSSGSHSISLHVSPSLCVSSGSHSISLHVSPSLCVSSGSHSISLHVSPSLCVSSPIGNVVWKVNCPMEIFLHLLLKSLLKMHFSRLTFLG